MLEAQIEHLKKRLAGVDKKLAALYRQNRLLAFRIDKLQQLRVQIANDMVITRQALSEQKLRQLFGTLENNID